MLSPVVNTSCFTCADHFLPALPRDQRKWNDWGFIHCTAGLTLCLYLGRPGCWYTFGLHTYLWNCCHIPTVGTSFLAVVLAIKAKGKKLIVKVY